jgi:hypothetical protein
MLSMKEEVLIAFVTEAPELKLLHEVLQDLIEDIQLHNKATAFNHQLYELVDMNDRLLELLSKYGEGVVDNGSRCS